MVELSAPLLTKELKFFREEGASVFEGYLLLSKQEVEVSREPV